MPNQIINISPTMTNLLGSFTEDSVIILCDTSSGEFSSEIPDGFLSKCVNVKLFNIGIYDIVLNFKSKSLLYFYNGYISSVVIGAGQSFEMFNEPITGKWRSVTDPSIRLIWDDFRLKGQVYQDNAWHTCFKGGY
jgi:hypothetical protein